MDNDEIEELSQRGEIFRSKLIEDFQLLDTLKSKGSIESPRFYSNEIQDPVIMDKLLKESPFSLVKFQVYSKREELKFNDRRLNRVRNKNRIPFGPWARTVTDNAQVQNFIMFLIITNSIVLGIQAEISEMNGKTIEWIKVLLNIFDYITLVVFVMEILIKWLDGFWIFWKNGWNIFDFFVTAMSIVPEVINLVLGGKSSSSISVIGDNMRVFKILRSLKMVSRFAQLRIIVLTIFKAFKSMAFILILLVLFMYIFAVAGTIIFDSYSKSTRTDLQYRNSFSTLKNAFITLFQLFTLDHWFVILKDMVKAVNPAVARIYVILWICIGAFVFRNIFAGIMVNNFQNIRNDFHQQMREQIAEKERAEVRNHLAEELEKQDKRHSKSRRISDLGVETQEEPEDKYRRSSSFLNKIFRKSTANALGTLTEEPKKQEHSKQETKKKNQPNFVAQLQEKISQIRSSERHETSNMKSSFSFHAYYSAPHSEGRIDEQVLNIGETSNGGASHKNFLDVKTVAETRMNSCDEVNEDKIIDNVDDTLEMENSKATTNDPKEDTTKRSVTDDRKSVDLEADFADWQNTVEANLHNFERYPVETLWPRNTLFKYFQLMEQLQENLVERKQLNRLLVEVLLKLQDSTKVTKM